MEFTVGSKYETKTNYRKLIQDFERTLVIETFANSLDTEATRIEIYVDDGHRIKDNGKGMTAYEFTEYNNVASLTKVKGTGGIGFAGVGAKIYLDNKAECIITETRTKDFCGANKWVCRR